MTPFLLPQIEISYPNVRLSIKTFIRQKILTASGQHHFLKLTPFLWPVKNKFYMWRHLNSKRMFWGPEEHGVRKNARHGWTSCRILQRFLERYFLLFNVGPQLWVWIWLPLSNTKTRGCKTYLKKRCGIILHQKLKASYPFKHWLQNCRKINCKPN